MENTFETKYQGFRKHPVYKQYAANKEGNIINLSTLKPIKYIIKLNNHSYGCSHFFREYFFCGRGRFGI